MTRRDPVMVLVFTYLTCGLFSFYVYCRNAEIIHNALTARGIAHENKQQTVLLLVLATFVAGITGWISPLVLQDEYNKLAG